MFCGNDGWDAYTFDIGEGSREWPLHRYDSWNKAYSPSGLTQWRYVQTDCHEQNGFVTCVVTNTYEHTVYNVTVSLAYPASWYDEDGEPLANGTSHYTIPSLESGSNLTLTIVLQEFGIPITRPTLGIYLANIPLLPFPNPVIIGAIIVQAEVLYGNISNVNRVEFSLDDSLHFMDTEPFSE